MMFWGEARKNIKPMVDAPHNDQMREWSKRTVCKTDGRNPLVGSNPTLVTRYAQVVELVDTRVSKTLARKGVWVQVPPWVQRTEVVVTEPIRKVS